MTQRRQTFHRRHNDEEEENKWKKVKWIFIITFMCSYEHRKLMDFVVFVDLKCSTIFRQSHSLALNTNIFRLSFFRQNRPFLSKKGHSKFFCDKSHRSQKIDDSWIVIAIYRNVNNSDGQRTKCAEKTTLSLTAAIKLHQSATVISSAIYGKWFMAMGGHTSTHTQTLKIHSPLCVNQLQILFPWRSRQFLIEASVFFSFIWWRDIGRGWSSEHRLTWNLS